MDNEKDYENMSQEFKNELLKVNRMYIDKNYEGSYQGYMALLIDEPGNPYILHNLAVTCYHLKKYAEAAAHFNVALTYGGFSNNANAYVNGANNAVCAGDMIKAKEFIERAYTIQPSDAKVASLYKKIAGCFIKKID